MIETFPLLVTLRYLEIFPPQPWFLVIDLPAFNRAVTRQSSYSRSPYCLPRVDGGRRLSWHLQEMHSAVCDRAIMPIVLQARRSGDPRTHMDHGLTQIGNRQAASSLGS